MFDQIDLIAITMTQNKNGEKIETEARITVPVEMQTIRREVRDKYNEKGLGRALRFKIYLFGISYNLDNIPYFIHNGIKYNVTDFNKEKTGSSYFIEGTSSRGGII